MRRPILTVILGTALCLVASSAVAGTAIVTPPVDQAGFQALIYAASPGDTILCLGGVYDFTASGPVLIDKGLKILAADPADPPVFVGDGTYFTDALTGNNGFLQVQGSFIDGLTFQGLHFEDFDRTLMFPNSRDLTVPGCPQIAGAGARDVKILDNTSRNSRRFFQAFGGPFEDFVVKGNDSDAFELGAFVYGSGTICDADGEFYALMRPRRGVIQANHFQTEFVSIFVDAAKRVSVKENHVVGGLAGIFFLDDTAFYAPDDGPIRLGDVKSNTVDGAFYGLLLEGPTTIERTQIKDNEINGAFIGALLDFGANGFEVKANHFSMSDFADVYLGLDEDTLIIDGCFPGVDADAAGACAPGTYGNVVKVYEGDAVLDYGDDNVVKVE